MWRPSHRTAGVVTPGRSQSGAVGYLTGPHNGGMCGRYADFLTAQELTDTFALGGTAPQPRLLAPSYNVAPTHLVHVIHSHNGPRQLDVARWGLVPSWARDASSAARLINARVETVDAKPSFSTAFAKRRCVVPASGYFEWSTHAGTKAPYFIHRADATPLAFAGLLSAWRAREDDEWLITCAIVTTAAHGPLADLHERAPVMLSDEAWHTWLDPDSSADDLFAAAASDAADVTWHRVSDAVGQVRNNQPSLIEPVTLL